MAPTTEVEEPSFVNLDQHALEAEADAAVAPSSPEVLAQPTASDAGREAALQRERAAQPKKALDGLASSGPSSGKPTLFGWGGRSGARLFSSKADKSAGAGSEGGKVQGDDEKGGAVDGNAIGVLEAAIEKNQAEQDLLRRQLHAKAEELSALLSQHAALMRAQAEAHDDAQPAVGSEVEIG